MSHTHDHDPTVPKQALIAAAVLLSFTLGVTALTSYGLIPRSGDPEGSRMAHNVAPAQQRELHFSDRSDGAVVVTDARTGETVLSIGFGQGGFVRATMRRMAKARAAKGLGPEQAFTLTRWENGALSLSDPATGETAEIYGFGPDHTATFAAMLKEPGQ